QPRHAATGPGAGGRAPGGTGLGGRRRRSGRNLHGAPEPSLRAGRPAWRPVAPPPARGARPRHPRLRVHVRIDGAAGGEHPFHAGGPADRRPARSPRQGVVMPKYLSLFAYTGEAWSRMVAHPNDRTEAARKLIEDMGGTMECFYWMLG